MRELFNLVAKNTIGLALTSLALTSLLSFSSVAEAFVCERLFRSAEIPMPTELTPGFTFMGSTKHGDLIVQGWKTEVTVRIGGLPVARIPYSKFEASNNAARSTATSTLFTADVPGIKPETFVSVVTTESVLGTGLAAVSVAGGPTPVRLMALRPVGYELIRIQKFEHARRTTLEAWLVDNVNIDRNSVSSIETYDVKNSQSPHGSLAAVIRRRADAGPNLYFFFRLTTDAPNLATTPTGGSFETQSTADFFREKFPENILTPLRDTRFN